MKVDFSWSIQPDRFLNQGQELSHHMRSLPEM